jgi:hypothetical protein
MSALPKAVQDQVDLANKLAEQVYDENGKLRTEPVPEQPKAEEPEAPKKEVEPPKKEEPKADDWEHKFKVLQGKYNAEVPRLQKQLNESNDDRRELKQRMLNLEGMLASLQAVREPPKEEPKKAQPVISDEEREQFGDDLIDLIKRVSLNATLPEIESHLKPLEGRVKQVDEKVATSQKSMAESKRQQVFDRLAAAVPNWEQQNEDENFLNWLDEDEGLTKRPRAYFLTEAMKANDADTVIAYFTSFQGENAAATPSEPAPAQESKPEPQVKLDELTAPGTPQTGTASAPNESGKRVWTRADITRFYEDRNEFIKRGKPIPKELQSLEKDIFAAQAEGRVR